MPRQLPWLNNGGRGRAHVKQPCQPRAESALPGDSEDESIDGAVLGNSSGGKGKGKALREDDDSDDELPHLSTGPSTPRTKSRTKNASNRDRAPSSSPSPISEILQPRIEYMRQGVSRFDLRDDEWMMVEDEFLETAKLFTRHLHIAEYEKLKERIEAKKKAQVRGARYVSLTDGTKKTTELQSKRQQKSIHEIFAPQHDGEEEEKEEEQTAPLSRNSTYTIEQPPRRAPSHDSDSEDLDAPRPPAMRPSPHTPVAVPSTTGPKPTSSTTPMRKSARSPPSFAKPVLPAPRPRVPARKSRFNIDMLDDYVPPSDRTPSTDNRSSLASKAPARSNIHPAQLPTTSMPTPLPVKTASASAEMKASGECWSLGLSRETAERVAKRKAERGKEREGKKNKLDDIPTFLV